MIPRTITSNLARLRNRERLIRFVWGVCRFGAVVLALLIVACLVDYLIDRDRDTPWAVRYLLFGVQFLAAIIGGFFFVMWPQLRRLRDTEMALWVEEQTPRLGHRLISAVQLNEPGADVQGMSKELIVVVTQEAEKQAARVHFAGIANHGRLFWSALVLLPVMLVAALLFALWPGMTL